MDGSTEVLAVLGGVGTFVGTVSTAWMAYKTWQANERRKQVELDANMAAQAANERRKEVEADSKEVFAQAEEKRRDKDYVIANYERLVERIKTEYKRDGVLISRLQADFQACREECVRKEERIKQLEEENENLTRERSP